MYFKCLSVTGVYTPALQRCSTSFCAVQTAAYQRKLLQVAVQLLKPGGHLVFSTCTINPGDLTAPFACWSPVVSETFNIH